MQGAVWRRCRDVAIISYAHSDEVIDNCSGDPAGLDGVATDGEDAEAWCSRPEGGAAHRWLLKPFDNARFERALSRAQDKIQRHRPAPGTGRLTVRSAGQI